MKYEVVRSISRFMRHVSIAYMNHQESTLETTMPDLINKLDDALKNTGINRKVTKLCEFLGTSGNSYNVFKI